MRPKLIAIVSTCLLAAGFSFAEIPLYDGSLGTLPAAQGWIYLATPFMAESATQAAVGDAARLDTTPVTTDSAGYFGQFHPSLPNMDQAAGITVRFDVRILEETHVTTNRAGFSIIVIASDLGSIEIGMWTNEIWAQSDSPLFTHAESVAYDTTGATNRYELTCYKGTYELTANGVLILQGPLRDYSAFAGFPDPYETENFIFLGDDTSSAAAEADIAYVSISLLPYMYASYVESNTLFIAVSNLEAGVSYDVERGTGLVSTAWTSVHSFAPTGTTGHVILPLVATNPPLALRISGTD